MKAIGFLIDLPVHVHVFEGFMWITLCINHGQEVYISDISPAVEEVIVNIIIIPQGLGIFPLISRWYSTDVLQLDMVDSVLHK